MTSDNTRVPSGGVVVIGTLSDATRQRVAEATDAKLVKISETPSTYAVESDAGNLRQLSERINEVVGSEGVVAPMLADGEGNRLIPTGRMQVRFKKPPTETSLTTFAKRHKVELTAQNKWSPQQVEFAVRSDDTRYFPDVATAMDADKTVTTAWPDVKAAFRREIT